MNNTNDRLEDKIKTHADKIFVCEELDAGHRERFAKRLDAMRTNALQASTDVHSEDKTTKTGRTILLRVIYTGIVAAAVLVGAWLFLSPPEMNEPSVQGDSSADVRNYYAMLFENELETTKQMLHQTDCQNLDMMNDELQSIASDEMPDIQMPDDDKITIIVRVYSSKIAALQQIQTIITRTKTKES